MSKVYTDPSNYTAIAAAIRAKNGSETTYKPSQMAAAIRAIETEPDLVDVTITENGTYTHSGHDGYDEVVVNVSGGGEAWTQKCDMVPHGGYYTSSTTLQTGTTDPVYNYVVPLSQNKVYIIRADTPGNRFRVTTWAADPTTLTSGTALRNLAEVSSPSAGYEIYFYSQSTEAYLNIYYTNSGESGVVIDVYEAQKP